jgi:hypothetical protein
MPTTISIYGNIIYKPRSFLKMPEHQRLREEHSEVLSRGAHCLQSCLRRCIAEATMTLFSRTTTRLQVQRQQVQCRTEEIRRVEGD